MAVFPPGQVPPNFAAEIKRNAEGVGKGRSSVTSMTLPSGVTLLHESKQDAPMESFTVAIRAGDRDGSAGVAGATAGMLVRETGRYSKTELQNLLDEQGFTLDAWTTSDATYVSLQAPAGSSTTAMALLVDVLGNPAFSPTEWDDVRREMLADLEGAMDQPRAVAADLLSKTVFAGTAYGRSMADEAAALEKLSAPDLRKFWARHYKSAAIAIAYTGAVSTRQLQDGLAPLSKLKGAALAQTPVDVAAIEAVVHVPEAMAGKTQNNLYVAWHAPKFDTDDWILWALAEKAFGGDLAGRLWKLRQEEGLAYSVWAFGSADVEQPLAMIYMATAGEQREAALAAIHREVGKLRSGLSQHELDRVKVSYLANLNRLDRTAARRSQRHAEWWVYGFGADRRAQLTAAINGATLDRVNAVIREVLDPDSYVFVEAGAVGEPAQPE
jgi:predicted Zn-dependent peptidase